MDIVKLAQLAELHQLQHERSLLEMLDHPRAVDPEVADQAIHVFDDRTRAATWLAHLVRSLGGVTPLQGPRRGLARGRAARPPPVLLRCLWVGACATQATALVTSLREFVIPRQS